MFYQRNVNLKSRRKILKKIKLISDGASDLTPENIKKYDVSVIPFWVNYENESKLLTSDELYEMMKNNPKMHFKTACPSIEDFASEFEKAILNNQEVLCICLSSKFSGSYESALLAKKSILEKYPDAVINVVDSLMCSAQQGLLVLSVAEMIENDFEVAKILENIEELKKESKIFITVKTLDYLRAGGRIGKLSSILLNILAVKPIIIMEDGNIKSGGKAIGLGMTLQKIIGEIKKLFENTAKKIKDFKFCVGYSTDKILAERFMNDAIKKLNIDKQNITLNQIGSTAGVHTGPETIGIASIRDYQTLSA